MLMCMHTVFFIADCTNVMKYLAIFVVAFITLGVAQSKKKYKEKGTNIVTSLIKHG